MRSLNNRVKRVIKFILKLVNQPIFNSRIRGFIKKAYLFTPWRLRSFLKRKLFYSQFISKRDLCFEFVKEFPIKIKRCLESLLSIGSAKFNFTIDKNLDFFFRKRLNENQLYESILSIDNDRLCGDIYVKFI